MVSIWPSPLFQAITVVSGEGPLRTARLAKSYRASQVGKGKSWPAATCRPACCSRSWRTLKPTKLAPSSRGTPQNLPLRNQASVALGRKSLRGSTRACL